jgi:type I restriction enzyme S subunit
LLKSYKSIIVRKQSGTVFGSINKNDIENLKLPFPPLNEQKAIAKILSDLDEKIEINNRINKVLEEIAQTIFKRWFVDFEFPNENGEPYKSSGGEMVESELGPIPKGWEVGRLGDIIEISSGKRPKDKSDYHLEQYKIPIIGASKIMGFTKEYLYREPVLVIGRVGTHGVIQRFNEAIWPSDNTLVIKTKYCEFVYNILKNIDYTSLNRGSTQPLITQTDIKNVMILCPNNELLMNFENVIKNYNMLIETLQKEIIILQNLRDTLLPKLMSGEIRVDLNNGQVILKNNED